MNRSLARGIGIGLVVALSGLFLMAFSLMGHPGIWMMGNHSRGYAFADRCTPPTNLTGSTINVAVFDMGMMMHASNRMGLSAFPSEVPQGRVNILVTNMGMRTHEVVVLPLADGQKVGTRIVGGDGKIDESESLGEASKTCGSGSGDGILSGSQGWVTLNLPPGRYEFLCNLPNHYSAGMYQEIVVRG